MISIKRFFALLIVLGLSLGLVTVALAAADTARGGFAPEDKANLSLETAVDSAPLALGNMYVNYAHDWVGVETTPYAVVTVTMASGYWVTGTADDGGWFGTYAWPWTPENPNIVVGDVITAETIGIQSTVNPVGQVNIEPDYDTDTVAGTIEAPWFLTVTVSCEVWEMGAPSIVITDVLGDGGSYFCDFTTEGWDLRLGQMIAVSYWEPDGDSVINIYDPRMRVNYAHDWVGGDYEAGHTFWITVTESNSDTVKATAQLDTTPDGGWGTSGFETVDEHWFPSQPDIMAGDWVFFQSDDGYYNEIQVGDISGTLDLDTDSVSGPINADWFTETLDVECHPWGGPESAPVKNSTAEPDGSSPYFCQWDPGTEWDILPGQDVAVMYVEPDQDRVINVFREPAPDLAVEKQNTPGHAVPGGSVMYQIRYWNDGDGVAEDTIITDTLPADTTYASNSREFPAITNGSVVTFSLGSVPSGASGEFFVALDVDGGVPIDSELEENCVGIATSSEGDTNPDNNQSCSGPAWVTDGDHGLWIDKWPEPNDPHPGQTFQYVIDYGTEGGAANGPAWLTDTLPADTEVVGWYDEYGWDGLWTEVITTGGQFVLHAPAGIPGDMGGRIRLTLLLDGGVSVGTTLENTVVITTAGDIDPGNNMDFDDSAHASAERYDLRLEKDISNQVPVPGGWLNYFINYNNQGNVETHVWVTDTLPAGVEFEGAWWGGGDQPNADEPLPPPTIIGNQLIWDLETLEVAGSRWFHIQVNISDTLPVGEVLTNCAVIGGDGPEDTPADNSDCVAVTLNDPGPNLRVSKWYNWQNDNNQLEYTIHFENIGDQTINDVWITDTLPTDTTWNGWWHMDFDWEELISESLSSDMLLWQFSDMNPGDNGWIYFQADLDNPDARPGYYTNTVEIDIPPGDVNPSDNVFEVGAVLGEVERVEFWVGTERTDFWGEAQEGVVVTVTTPYTEVYAWADPGCGGCWDIGNAGPLWPGDVVVAKAGGGLLPVVINIPDPFSAEVDSTTDTVWGQLGGVVEQELQIHGDWPNGYQEVTTDGSGNYSAAYADIPRGGEGYIRYNPMVTYAEVMFHRRFQTPDLVMEINYGHNWIEGNYEVGHTVWLTVTESDGVTVKGRAELTSGYVPWWGGGTGFSTNWQGWLGEQPDIQAGDWVFGRVDNGETTEVQLGDISGFVDADIDTITGTFDAEWLLPDPVELECRTWGAPWWAPNPQNKYDSILSNGTDTYTCSWDPVNEWDVEPGQSIAVYYKDPDTRNDIGNVFQEPAPYLRVEKWANGQPGEGGNIIFYLQYVNQGDADAENVVITDTMLGGLTYLADTSGLPSSGSGTPGDPLVWDVGLLPPGDWIQFEIFAEVTASQGEWVTNTAEIATSNPYDQGEPWEKYAEWSGEVVANDTHLNVGKWPWTGDPAPGYEFVWAVNVCNNGSTDSSEVILTDTLPISTTLMNWWGQHPGWMEVSQDATQLVLSRPAIQAWWCGQVYLRFLLDPMASPGLGISNTVTIQASNDLETDDNYTESWVWVNDPHTNLSTSKWWNWGQLVPGGRISYGIEANNGGNVPVDDVLITDTLPVDTSLVGIWAYDQDWNYLGEVTPLVVTPEYVVWEVGNLENGFRVNYEVQIDIDSDATPGTILLNTSEISPKPNEDTYDDNISTWVEEVFDHGPNLRIHKGGSWDDWGENTRRASYWLNVENVGDEAVMSVVITDTYDSGMYLDGGVDVSYWRWWNWNDLGGYFTVTLESLYPGDNVGINFGTITDTEPLPFGLVFTNTAEVSLVPGDTNPDDNVSQKILTTGPELYITKDLIAGEVLPGELITFSLAFGNDRYGHEWWWNMQGDLLLTDTLPAGLEYITSTLSWCGWSGQEWCDFPANVDGNELSWHMWPFGSGERYEIHLTVQVTDTAQSGDIFTNQVEIASSEPISDTEAYYDNNIDSYDAIVTLPVFDVAKTYETTMIAGTDVVYTLTATNTGNEAGTTVVLSDTVPANLTYGDSDGTLVGGDVLWTFASVAPDGGIASGWFSGTLACTAGLTVDNEHYRVVSSDQGVVSEDGNLVSFTISAPTITADFIQSAGTILVGESVTFTATATTDGTGLSYAWTFGDGGNGNGEIVAHTYVISGTYDVALTVTDTCGYTDTITIEDAVTVVPTPVPDFSVAKTYETSMVAGTDVVYTLTVTNNGNEAGTTVVLSDTVPANLTYGGSDGTLVGGDVLWTFASVAPDGGIASGWFSGALACTAGLSVDNEHYRVTSSDQGVASEEGDLVSFTIISPTITVSFTQSTDTIYAGGQVDFTAMAATDGTALTYAWDFGDGGTGTGETASHIYLTPGVYDVTLTVTDGCGYSETITIEDAVTVEMVNFLIHLPLIYK